MWGGVGGPILKHLWLKKDWFDRLLTTAVFHSVVINIFQIKVVVIRENWYADEIIAQFLGVNGRTKKKLKHSQNEKIKRSYRLF